MSGYDYEPEIYLLSDEDGVESEFELVGETELNGNRYLAMIPVDAADDNSDILNYVILKEVTEDGEVALVTVDDDDEFDEIADVFDRIFEAEIEGDL